MTDTIKSIKNAFNRAKTRPRKIFYYTETDSTNERARCFSKSPECDLEVELDGIDAELFIADAQTAGRGRLGRRFVSNPGAGLYMSLRFEFTGDMCDSVGITPQAAVALCQALESTCGAMAQIKWVNDVYMNGRKLAGILTESTVLPSGKRIFICGIGINLLPSDMPSEVAEIATDLKSCGFSPDRFTLAATVCEGLLEGISDLFNPSRLAEYKDRSFLIGRQVKVIGDGEYTATVSDITDRYELIVELDDGSKKSLSTGEVSIKL